MTTPKSSMSKLVTVAVTCTITVVVAAPALAGLGMTPPVQPPAEGCTVSISPFSPPTAPLSTDYQIAPPAMLDPTPEGFTQTPTGPEASGRLHPFLRHEAQVANSTQSRQALVDAVLLYMGAYALPPGVQPFGANIDPRSVAMNVAQLTVTGRHALDSFVGWHAEAGAFSGPQDEDLMRMVQQAAPTADFPSLVVAVKFVLDTAYSTLWAIRSNDPAARAARTQMGWIAVSGEDDTPHRPVNVGTAPYPQYDLAIPMQFPNGPVMVRTRYMVATGQNFIPPPATGRGLARPPISFRPAPMPPVAAAAAMGRPLVPIDSPPIPIAAPPSPAPAPSPSVAIALPPPVLAAPAPAPAPSPPAAVALPPPVLAAPAPAPAPAPPIASIPDAPSGILQPPRTRYTPPPPRPLPIDTPAIPTNTPIIIYVHGGGSRLEEAVELGRRLIETGQKVGQDYTILSLDMPNSGYGDSFDPVAIDPQTANPFYDAMNFPILSFDENYLIGFIETLDQQFGNIKNRIVAVMGGSLGGNLSLISASLAGPAHPYFNTMVAWSPTAMIKTSDVSRQLVASPAGNLNGLNWGAEQPGTRRQYMTHLYFEPLSSFLGMPADPQLWYRDGFMGTGLMANQPPRAIDCKAFRVAQSRFDRYEIYSPAIRRWTTALDTEQAILDFRMPDPKSGSPLPRYLTMKSRLLLAVGRDDCISCDPHAPLAGAFIAASAGETAGSIAGSIAGTILLGPFGTPLGTAGGFVAGGIYGGGVQSLMNVDIQGYTHDVAALMANTPGRTLFIADTGHSIHDERPIFFAQEIVDFLTHTDTNLEITVGTGGDDLRWNSQVWAGLTNNAGQTVNWKLNEWWHPWNANPPATDNPCGLCAQLNYFSLPIGSQLKFTLGLSRTPIAVGDIKTLGIQFVGGQSGPFDTGDAWDLAFVTLFSISGPAGPGQMVMKSGGPLQRMFAPQGLWVTPVGAPNRPPP